MNLSQIAPAWDAAIKDHGNLIPAWAPLGSYATEPDLADIGSFKTCIVGEFHGFSDHYIGEGGEDYSPGETPECERCAGYAREFDKHFYEGARALTAKRLGKPHARRALAEARRETATTIRMFVEHCRDEHDPDAQRPAMGGGKA